MGSRCSRWPSCVIYIQRSPRSSSSMNVGPREPHSVKIHFSLFPLLVAAKNSLADAFFSFPQLRRGGAISSETAQIMSMREISCIFPSKLYVQGAGDPARRTRLTVLSLLYGLSRDGDDQCRSARRLRIACACGFANSEPDTSTSRDRSARGQPR